MRHHAQTDAKSDPVYSAGNALYALPSGKKGDYSRPCRELLPARYARRWQGIVPERFPVICPECGHVFPVKSGEIQTDKTAEIKKIENQKGFCFLFSG